MTSPALTKPMILNAFQKAVLEDYSDGDFSYLIEDGAIANVRDLGDSLLSFMLIELSTQEGCTTIDDAVSRLNSGRDDIDVALEAMEKLAEAIAEKLEVRSRIEQGANTGSDVIRAT